MATSLPIEVSQYTDLTHYAGTLPGARIPAIREVGVEDYLEQHFEPTYGVQWIAFKADGPTKMTRSLVRALRKTTTAVENRARRENSSAGELQIRYQVVASNIPGIFNLGGDLEYISSLIRDKDRANLIAFGRDCIELVYQTAVSYHLPVTTISLVQGTALGGGFEAALAANVLVAERGTKMGLPEVMFNMFPGMGAYHLLARRIPPVAAERMIQSGRTYTAEELYDRGIVDVLAEPGDGENAVWDYIKRQRRQSHGEWGLRRVVEATNPTLRLEDLIASIDIWADTALALSEADLKHMDFLIRAQKSKGI